MARIIQKSGGEVDYLRAMKLIYLADRESIVKRGIPIIGGRYYSMPKGPTIGNVMNFVTQRNAPRWKELIAARVGNQISLVSNPKCEFLSESEIQILDEVVKEHRNRTTEELVKWCHAHCPEYKHVKVGRQTISVEEILKAEGKSPQRIECVVREGLDLAELDSLLSLKPGACSRIGILARRPSVVRSF